ncbi:OsmC family protein [Phragmitibacter flavus]|uniref:OsmC family protein n=1 Tax=Phragmitibacter flavus TaxID=2576071 RepID=A0A5R8KGL3_9BACT|nr:OsmC family protein [Phragmitibacter flavus]TLD71446.1 OsmC family protein [Phragmitibacter flavus]
MVKIEATYEGDLRCRAIHGPSGTELITDAPTDNMGKGESFSPTDLVATALATCIATTMGIVAKRKEIALPNMRIHVEKHMTTEAPRRIASLPVKIWIPLPADYAERPLLEAAATGCPVHRSLHPDVQKPIEFIWGE